MVKVRLFYWWCRVCCIVLLTLCTFFFFFFFFLLARHDHNKIAPCLQFFELNWIEGWLHKHFEHCTNITFSKELIILGVRANLVTDRIIDLCILIAKNHIFTSKLQGATSHLNGFVQNMKNTFEVEKYYYIVNSRPNKFYKDWILYRSYFPWNWRVWKCLLIFVFFICLYTIDLYNYVNLIFVCVHCMFFCKL